jgi:hypothetical protein
VVPALYSFFNHLYALGTEGGTTIRKFWVFNPEAKGGPVENRFKAMLGFGASPHFHYFPLKFDEAVSELVYQYHGYAERFVHGRRAVFGPTAVW